MLDHPHCHSTALVVFSLLSRTLSYDVFHSPLVSSKRVIPCAQDTEQKHGKHGSGAPLSSFLLLFVVRSEHGGCLSFANLERARSSSTRV